MANVISDETIEYVGILAKLELSDEEKEAAKKDMGRMLDYIDKLGELDTTGVELSSGAVRNHDIEIMKKAFAIAGYDEETLKTKFGALYQAFQFGAPPHAGMAPGVDRMIMLLRNEDNIREVIAFPMNGNAQDLMCGAPGEVTDQQLREVHIKVRD